MTTDCSMLWIMLYHQTLALCLIRPERAMFAWTCQRCWRVEFRCLDWTAADLFLTPHDMKEDNNQITRQGLQMWGDCRDSSLPNTGSTITLSVLTPNCVLKRSYLRKEHFNPLCTGSWYDHLFTDQSNWEDNVANSRQPTPRRRWETALKIIYMIPPLHTPMPRPTQPSEINAIMGKSKAPIDHR